MMESSLEPLNGAIRNQFESLRKQEVEHYHGILAAVIVLSLLIIAGLVVGFVIVGLQTDDVSDIKSEVGDIWDALKEQQAELDDIKLCTEQIKANISELQQNLTNIIEEAVLAELEDFFPRPLPLSRVLCDHEQDIPVPADAYVLISSNLTNTEAFPFTSIEYNFESGVIEVGSPNLGSDQTVIIQFEIRVFITEIPSDGIYSLVLSTSANCDYDDCPAGFYSVTQRYVDANPEWGVGNLWMTLKTNLPAQVGQRYFVFLGSKGGGGMVPGTAQEGVSTCAALYISVTAVTPTFLSP